MSDDETLHDRPPPLPPRQSALSSPESVTLVFVLGGGTKLPEQAVALAAVGFPHSRIRNPHDH